MKRSFLIVAALAAAVTLGACQSTSMRSDGEASATDAIDQIGEDWVDVFNSRQWDGFRELVADDVVLMPQGAPMITGIDNYIEFHDQAAPPGAMSITVDYTTEHDGLAYSFGAWTIDIPMEDGQTASLVGKWLSVFAQDASGDWRMHRQIWNEDAP